MNRPLQIEAFDVLDRRIVAVDSVLPIVAEFAPNGAATSIWQWELDPTRRGRPTAKDVLDSDRHTRHFAGGWRSRPN